MRKNAMTKTSDSQNQAVEIHPRNERIYTLTPLGRAACKWIEKQDQASDEFAYFCPGCLRQLSVCSCPMSDPS